jgi:hypothetical protein
MRILVIIGAYLAACVVAAVAFGAAIAVTLLPSREYFVATIFGSALYTAPVIAVLAALPASVTIVYAERYGRRSALFYAGAGLVSAIVGLAAINAFLLAAGLHSQSGFKIDAGLPGAIARTSVLFGLPGLAGGLSYWWIAGRSA